MTIIDYIITNNRNILAGINNTNKISDHKAIQIIIRSNSTTINAGKETKEMELFKYNKTLLSRRIYGITAINKNNNLNNNVRFSIII